MKIMAICEALSINNLFEIDSGLALKMFGLSGYIKYMLVKYPYMKTANYMEIRGKLFEKLSIFELNLSKNTQDSP